MRNKAKKQFDMTLNQRLTNKAKKQLIAANKIYPQHVADIRSALKEVDYVSELPFFIGCDMCSMVFNSPTSRSLVIDAFKPIV